MPKKLTIDSLSSERTSVNQLLENSKRSGDFVGELQFKYKLNELDKKIEELKENSFKYNNASVAIFFGGKPVLGSKGIAAEFAGSALGQFQNLIAKTFAISEMGELGERGKIPLKVNSELMITGLARGSFGFVLDEISEQTEIEASALTHIIDKVTHLLRDIAAQDEMVFEKLLENLDPRTLNSLKEFFANLDSSEATLRIVERDLDIILDSTAIHRGKIRTETISIEENTTTIKGILDGFLPDHRKFEIRNEQGNIIYGSATKEAVDQFTKTTQTVIGKQCLVKLAIKTITPLNRPPRDVIRLIEFLQFGQ